MEKTFKPLLALGLLLLSGCNFPVQEYTDSTVGSLARSTIDLQPLLPADETPAPAPHVGKSQLAMPPGLPGADAPPIILPDPNDPAYRRKKNEALAKLYPELPLLGPNPTIQPGPSGRPLTLADLQRIAVSNSPLIRQAAADVEAAKGAVIQAGAYPNPTVGLEFDQLGTSGTDYRGGGGYQGAFVEQVIKTGGKLRLAQAAARIDFQNAELALRRSQTDLAFQVRTGYFQVLVALENIHINELLVKLTNAAFKAQLEKARAGAAAAAAPYEPMQLRVLDYQARIALIHARNTYTAAWKQLAATMGEPGMPSTELAGKAEMPVPGFRYDAVLARVLSTHSDVAVAENSILKARYNLKRAQVTPIPDVGVRAMLQKDFTTPPFPITPSVSVSVPVPVWDHNKGGIIQAQGALLRATEEVHRVRDALTFSLADAFNRYDTNLKALEKYRLALQDQVRVFRGVYERHQQQPEVVSFGDIVTAQQTLAGLLTSYVQTLSLEWQAVAEVANLMQTNDLFQMQDDLVDLHCGTVQSLEQLAELPCCHPADPLPDPKLKAADGSWPEPILTPGRAEVGPGAILAK